MAMFSALADIVGGGVKGNLSSGKFYYNGGTLEELYNIMKMDVHTSVANAIEGIYSNLTEMGDGWSGKGYDTYSGKLFAYRDHLSTYLFFVLAYAEVLHRAWIDGQALNAKINKFLSLQ